MEESFDMAELEQLLPFYVNGRLEPDVCARIDAALKTSPALREELTALSRLAQMVRAGGIEMTQGADTSEARLEKVMAQLDDKPQPATEQPASPKPAPVQSGFLNFLNPRNWHPAVALTLAVAALGQAAMITSMQKKVGELEYELASGPGGIQRGDVMITIKADASWTAVEALLGKEGLTIVGGPSDGAITLASPAEGAELDALITRLRASPLIASADKAA
jgi:hypothetical protein